MTTASVYYLHGIQLASAFMSQLTDATPASNLSDLLEFPAGQTGPMFAGSHGAVPDVQFTTKQIGDLLDEMTAEAIAADLTAGSVDLYYKKGNPHGLREADAGLLHERYRLTTNALLYLQSIRASQGSDAEATARLLPVWDGTNNPIIPTGSLALAGTSSASHTYTLGRIDLNGTNISGVQEMDLQLNVEPEEVADSGEPYISYGGINRYAPTITLRTRDTTVMRTYGFTGTAVSSFEVYLRKRSAASINVADGTAEHIKISGTAGLIKARQVSGNDGMAEVFVQVLKPSAAGAPLTISTGSAIT